MKMSDFYGLLPVTRSIFYMKQFQQITNLNRYAEQTSYCIKCPQVKAGLFINYNVHDAEF